MAAPTPDLEAFIAAVQGKRDRESVRLTTVTWNNFTEVLTLKIDRTYWPAYEISWGMAPCPVASHAALPDCVPVAGWHSTPL